MPRCLWFSVAKVHIKITSVNLHWCVYFQLYLCVSDLIKSAFIWVNIFLWFLDLQLVNFFEYLPCSTVRWKIDWTASLAWCSRNFHFKCTLLFGMWLVAIYKWKHMGFCHKAYLASSRQHPWTQGFLGFTGTVNKNKNLATPIRCQSPAMVNFAKPAI